MLVADEMAGRLVSLALPHREGVFLVGTDTVGLSKWSVPLAARVIPLPEGGGLVGLGAG